MEPYMEQPSSGNLGKKKLSKSKMAAVSAVFAIVIIAAAVYYHHSIMYQTTDDAQIDGSIMPVRTKITGYVARVCFKDNDRVKKGDTLLVLETVDLQAQADQARARFEQACAGIGISRNSTESADLAISAADFSAGAAQENIASAEARLAQSQSDFDRIKKLYETGATTPQTFDAAKAALSTARAQLESARKQYQALQAQKKSAGSRMAVERFQGSVAKSRVAEAKAALDAAEYTLSNAVIVAAADGIVSKKNVEPGQLVLAGSAVASLVDISNIYVTANFKETQLDDISLGDVVTISIDAYKDVKICGIVQSFAGASGAKFALLPPDNASGNFVKVTQRVPVRIAVGSIVNPRGKPVLPGLNVVVSVKVK
jgi:membrane fusion protein, multidrug efflux system